MIVKQIQKWATPQVSIIVCEEPRYVGTVYGQSSTTFQAKHAQ